MSIVNIIKRHGADKIAFLALFVIALLLARLIIASRSAIVLSGPIELNHSGLSVSVPVGNGWQSEKQWKYYKNTFTLSSFFDTGSDSMTGMARCQYLLAATTAAADTVFKKKASELGGAIANTGQIRIDMPDSRFTKSSQNGTPLIINWAHIIRPKRLFDMFLGITELPYSRQLNIEVYQAGGDTDLAERVFKRLTETVKLQDNQALKAGSEIVAAIKSKGLESFFDPHFAKGKKEEGNFFLMKDKRGRSLGFAMDVLVTAPVLQQNRETQAYVIGPDVKSIQAANFYYVREPFEREQATFFQGQNNLDEFTWKSENSGIEGRSGAEIVLDKAAVITVKKFGKTIEDNTYQLSPVAIPNIFSDLTFIQMLNSNYEEIVMDIIDADGGILPLRISKIDKDDSVVRQLFGEAADQSEIALALRLELLDGRGFSERVYLDKQGQVLKRLLQREGVYIFERTDADTVLKQFPERAEYILRRSGLL